MGVFLLLFFYYYFVWDFKFFFSSRSAASFFSIRGARGLGAGEVMRVEENGIVSGSEIFITALQNKARCLQISKQAEGYF